MEKTLSIIKPNAINKDVIGDIIKTFESKSLKIAAARMTYIPRRQCEEFYSEHKERPFFSELVEFMTSGPVMLMVLSGENAISKNRKIMGATDPKEAAEDTLRKKYGDSVGENAIHGSDSPASAEREIKIFFKPEDILF